MSNFIMLQKILIMLHRICNNSTLTNQQSKKKNYRIKNICRTELLIHSKYTESFDKLQKLAKQLSTKAS